MPWSQLSTMDRKTQFIAEHLRHTLSFTELCALYQISRKTGYKVDRALRGAGRPGLSDRRRRPHSRPHQTPTELADAIISARRLHPTWGVKKLLAILSRRDPTQP